MRYFVNLGSHETEVDVVELPSAALEVRVGGKRYDVDVVDARGTLSVRIDGKVVDLTVEGQPPDIGAVASGLRAYVKVESERMRAAAAAKRKEGGAQSKDVRSPMPGRVVKVLVATGDAVELGQGLIVVEAMKMENELKAKQKGTIAAIHVASGDAVEANAKLLSFE